MIDLYEIRNGEQVKVAACPLSEAVRMGVRNFLKVQELLDRKMVYVRNEDNDADSR